MSRDAILSRIRKAQIGTTDAARAFVRAHDQVTKNRGLPPASLAASPASPSLHSRFVENLKRNGATVVTMDSIESIPAKLVCALHDIAPPARSLRVATDPIFATLPWDQTSGLDVIRGRAENSDVAALSHALAGISDTGSLVLASSPNNPTSLAFLPIVHIVAIDHRTIIDCLATALKRVCNQYVGQPMPRAINVISGPSRTGDIGGRIVTGAHGPQTLIVLIYGTGEPV